MPTSGMRSATGCPPAREDRFRHDDVEGSGHLERLLVAGDDVNGDSHGLDQAGVVGHAQIGLGMGALEHGALKALRGLDRPERATIDRAHHFVGVVHLLDGVDDGQRRDDCRVPLRDSGSNRRHDIGRHERTCGVMDENDADVVGEGQQCTGHGVLTGLTARDDADVGAKVLSVKEGSHLVDVLLRSSDHHEIDDPARSQGPNGVDEHRDATEGPQGLGRTRPEALAAASSGNERCRARGSLRQVSRRVRGRHDGDPLGGEDFVEDGLGLVLVGLLGEGELAHQDLAGLGQHALLTRGQAALTLTAPQVTDHLGDLDDIA